MAIELYWGSGSPFAWRVMLALEVKGLAYQSKLLEFSKGEHKTPAYLKLNRRGKFPTLKDGGSSSLRRSPSPLPRSQISRAPAVRQDARRDGFDLARARRM